MATVGSILFKLTSGVVIETAIPTEYVLIPEIAAAIIRHNWQIGPSYTPGWITFIRYVNYSS